MERIELFDTLQLAARWGVSVAHIKKLRQGGGLTFIRLGRRKSVRYRLVEDVRAFENSRAQNVQPSRAEYMAIRAAAQKHTVLAEKAA